ncbi:hypothetical protein OPKNFCMD_1528 [Methylobacterium crusticola]|uniref:Uncharacterized protein n=1 Tax=Methylobacterium crusticola TaxID=1697972 RepID=A0ABQ4QW49_9HYPH|nr:hypothetical protein [Methylobacterium crusticola]GJD48802.1 hypothetical protein OPKNFCMD_1528 [Methylobacterium crusticola]
MRHAFALLLLMAPFAGAALAQSAPRSVGDCERIKGDLAYNQCLSLFGPAAPTKAGAAPALSTPVRLPEPVASQEAEPAPRYRGRRSYGRRLRRGRQSATFAVISGSGSRYHRRRRR